MKTITAILLAATLAAVAAPNLTTYAVVNNLQLQAKIASGDVNPVVLRKRLKGYPNISLRTSLDGNWVIFESRVPGDIAYLRTRAQQEGIGYTEYDHAAMLDVVSGTNWTTEAVP